jgi:hypothetical protein
MNSFTKKFNRWVVKMESASAPGQLVKVTTRNGATKDVTLGAFLSEDKWGHYYDVVAPGRNPVTAAALEADAVEAEMHRLEAEIDRLQTQRDELAKTRARARMEDDAELHTDQERAAHRMER